MTKQEIEKLYKDLRWALTIVEQNIPLLEQDRWAETKSRLAELQLKYPELRGVRP